MEAATSDSSAGAEFTVLDWIGLVVVLLPVSFLLTWPWLLAPSYRLMFSEFGSELPLLTQLVLSPWPPLAFAVISVGLVAGATLLRGASIGNRCALAVAAFVVALVGVAMCFLGVYLPIFQLANSIE